VSLTDAPSFKVGSGLDSTTGTGAPTVTTSAATSCVQLLEKLN
jgi:hypothetical protein